MNKRNTQIVAVLAVLAAAPWIMATSGHGPVGEDSTVVTIVGSGRAEQSARLITVRAGVTAFSKTASRAMQDTNDVMAGLRSELRRHGIEAKDIRTTSLNLGRGTRRIDGRDVEGFNASHMLTVVFRDIGKSGAVIDALVDAGANQIQGPSFSMEPGDAALETARIAAIRDANLRADFFAKRLGMKIRRIVRMNEGHAYASGQPAASYRAAAGTEIDPGEDVVRASVYGEYELVK